MHRNIVQKISLAFASASVVIPSALASNSKFDSVLRRLDPQTRLEQICDMEAMTRIKQEGSFLPDRAKSAVASAPVVSQHTLTVNGGAFRSRGQWYELAFTCTGTADHMKVTSFDFRVGDLIPESKWSDLGLWR